MESQPQNPEFRNNPENFTCESRAVTYFIHLKLMTDPKTLTC